MLMSLEENTELTAIDGLHLKRSRWIAGPLPPVDEVPEHVTKLLRPQIGQSTFVRVLGPDGGFRRCAIPGQEGRHFRDCCPPGNAVKDLLVENQCD